MAIATNLFATVLLFCVSVKCKFAIMFFSHLHVKTMTESEMRRNKKCKGKNGIYFCLQNAFFSQIFIFFCNSLFLFAKSTFILFSILSFHLQNLIFNSFASICGIDLTP